MALHMPYKFEILELECGHTAPVFVWVEDLPTEVGCRSCGRAQAVKTAQVQPVERTSAVPRRLAASREAHMTTLAEELNEISLRYRSLGMAEAEADQRALDEVRGIEERVQPA